MMRLLYEVNGQKIASYAEARRLQPDGDLKKIYEEIIPEVKVDPVKIAKRIAYFGMLAKKKAMLEKEKGVTS